MRAGELLNHNRHVGEVARDLQRFIERQDGLRRHSGTQGRDVAGARAAFQPVDARPFADVVAVRGPGLEHLLFESRHDRTFRFVLLAIGIGGRESDVQTGRVEQALLDADDDRKIEDRVVGRNPDDRLFVNRRHDVPPASTG